MSLDHSGCCLLLFDVWVLHPDDHDGFVLVVLEEDRKIFLLLLRSAVLLALFVEVQALELGPVRLVQSLDHFVVDLELLSCWPSMLRYCYMLLLFHEALMVVQTEQKIFDRVLIDMADSWDHLYHDTIFHFVSHLLIEVVYYDNNLLDFQKQDVRSI